MRECINHHICDCHREKMERLERELQRLREAVLRLVGKSLDMGEETHVDTESFDELASIVLEWRKAVLWGETQ